MVLQFKKGATAFLILQIGFHFFGELVLIISTFAVATFYGSGTGNFKKLDPKYMEVILLGKRC
ncbi:hypothetical protein YQ22_04090 [Maribacter sp. 1_2014MBL_MicDiv]|nr:hypothetical protein YQ22_04090 [Maribacter sp. 1_2014MBL_MicDiv]